MAHDEQLTKREPIVVRPLELKDVEQMTRWGNHEDLRFLAYNFPYTSTLDHILWYRSKKRLLNRYIFGAFVGDQLMGYITLKQIKWVRREAFMGVAFDPNHLDQGYGTEAIKAYLDLVVHKYGMKRIFLKTACFNVRGQRCYGKVGFKEVERKFEPYEDQSQRFDMLMKYEGFQMLGDEIWTEYIYMVYEAK